MLSQFQPEQIFHFFLLFARLGAFMMLMPGIGERYVAQRIRLAFTLGLVLVLFPLLQAKLPAMPAEVWSVVLLMLAEVTVGVFIGMLARLAISALHVAGTVIAFQTSLAYAQTVDPNQGSQGALISAFFTLLGTTAIFVSGMHFIFIAAVVESYDVFKPGAALPLKDFATTAEMMVLKSFKVGIQMASPFIIYGIAFYTGLGILQRLMPQLQLFFIALPLQMVFGFSMLLFTLSISLMWFLQYFEETATMFLR